MRQLQTWNDGGAALAARRRRWLPVLAAVTLLSLLGIGSSLRAQETVAAAEPTYTARFADKKMARLSLSVISTAQSGDKRIRVSNLPRVKSDLLLDATLTTDSSNVPQQMRVRFGEMPVAGETAPALTDLEAMPVTRTTWTIRRPAQSGIIRYSGPVVATPVSLLFLGRQYNFKQGGPQTLTYLNDVNTPQTHTFNLTLTDGGKETLELDKGVKVSARKLLYKAPDAPMLGRREKEGVIYVGPIGEVLRCDSRLFGRPIRAESAAKRTTDGFTLALAGREATLVGTRTTDGWDVKLNIGENGYTVAAAQLDAQFRIVSLAGGRNMKQSAVFVNNEIRWQSEEGGANDVAVPDGRVWFLLHWFATDLWEAGASEGDFALNINAEQSGMYLPLFTGQRDGSVFTIQRLRDFGKVDGTTVRHYRVSVSGARVEALIVSGGRLPNPPPEVRAVYELYTDGTRLIYFAGSEGTTIVRDGWETWASGLPRVVKPAVPKPAEETEAERRRRGRRPRNP